MVGGCGRSESPPAPPEAPALPATRPSTQSLAHLIIRIVDLHSQKGQLLFCVFKSADGFPGDSKLAIFSQVQPTTNHVFTLDLPPGNYAAAVVHDENGNGKLDTNFIGIPVEGYGVTNNPKPKRRGAHYSEAVFPLPTSGASLDISIQYDFF